MQIQEYMNSTCFRRIKCADPFLLVTLAKRHIHNITCFTPQKKLLMNIQWCLCCVWNLPTNGLNHHPRAQYYLRVFRGRGPVNDLGNIKAAPPSEVVAEGDELHLSGNLCLTKCNLSTLICASKKAQRAFSRFMRDNNFLEKLLKDCQRVMLY